MRLGISNIAWDYEYDDEYLSLMEKFGFQTLEIAPTKIWPDLSIVSKEDCLVYLQTVNSHNLSLDSMQSILFGKSDLNLFTNPTTTLDYLRSVFILCDWLGIHKVVFGSPKNRHIPTDMDSDTSSRKAIEFFLSLSNLAQKHEVYICLEPNAKEYGCNFLTTTDEVVDFVTTVNHPNLKVHIDCGVIILNGEDMHKAISRASNSISHVHLSSPFLESLIPHPIQYVALRDELNKCNYGGNVVIEMKQQSLINNENYKMAQDTLALIRNIFQ